VEAKTIEETLDIVGRWEQSSPGEDPLIPRDQHKRSYPFMRKKGCSKESEFKRTHSSNTTLSDKLSHVLGGATSFRNAGLKKGFIIRENGRGGERSTFVEMQFAG